MKENITEASFQLFWKLQAFEEKELYTLSGKPVHILSCGRLNYGPGPDFLEACIRIGTTLHSGNIELHLRPKDWYTHNHHLDSSYDSVILHIFPSQPFESNLKTLNSSENTVEMMMIKFTEEHSFATKSSNSKPCSTSFLNNEILIKQAKTASNYYLTNSTQHLLNLGDSSLGLEMSFKQSVILRLFELLGSPYQKESGVRTGELLFKSLVVGKKINSKELIDISNLKKWGLGKSIETKINEAIMLSECIYSTTLPISLQEFQHYYSLLRSNINNDVSGLFWQQTLTRNIACLSSFTWASLIYQVKAMDYFSSLWEKLPTKLPNSVNKQVPEALRKPYNSYKVHTLYPNFLLDQHKSFCSKGNCLACNFFDNASSS
ncbi:MAG: DUF2851 family protein [Bacteroidetes bacterium]|nr:DUF2851 family protein [Bacteroidota bacterium]